MRRKNFYTHAYIRGSLMVMVTDRGWPCHEFESSTTKDLPCTEAMHVTSVESSNVLPRITDPESRSEITSSTAVIHTDSVTTSGAAWTVCTATIIETTLITEA
ncbi:hypothetical protein TNCV_2166111 [Trichonephila clavipes]|nr:hypothetical protein TNCV_2166111 [Trichonephila clavipes]